MKKFALHIALVFAAILSPWAALAQSITIPPQTIKTTILLNGVQVPISISLPAQTIPLPTPAAPSFPGGITYANGVLKVPGSISTGSLSLTGGTPMPVSSTGLYVLQLTGGFLQPVPYIPYVPGK